MTDGTSPNHPTRELPTPEWEHFQLYENVRDAIASLPIYFRTETHISGIMATDLHTLNTVLGATIEEQVVRTLNLIRSTWDPDEKYTLCSFVRQAQTFPDILLRRSSDAEVLLGIELKGWYLLAKESEPSLRFQTTSAACAVQDLIVVVPWVLGNVISGSPILFGPFVESAKFAAEYRNHHWQHIRQTEQDRKIEIPNNATPYPNKSDQILDKPVADRGSNFGRLARTGLMSSYMENLNDVQLCGIKTSYWRDFLKMFQESTTDVQARAALERLRKRVEKTKDIPSPMAQSALAIVGELERLLDMAAT
ncbi:MAG: hypothetical protein F4Y91_01215 [Gemmatimonadetes bacterium]|nr:hypothetical protein [Gemmatimonadota bacterium]MXY80713.1 hypothetical protein [Gemmatimonadota bacterium]MYB71325.1 hypothetical protein [Gemmatimonadota bacterium]